MRNESDTQLLSINRDTLTPLVRQALGSETAEVASWDAQQIHASATRARILRISGSAFDRRDRVPWSLVVKTIPSQPDRDEPSGPHYWKREILLYQSGLLDDLPGGLAAPRCLGITGQPGGEFWIWLEDVKDDIEPEWPLAHYGVVARHLGQFNGAYLVGRPVPSEPWLSRGWLRQWGAQDAPGIKRLRASQEHPLVRRVYPPAVAESLFRLWEERAAFLSALDDLPQTFCHLDAFRRNLLARHTADGRCQTVAIDWAFTGVGAIGEEIGSLVLASLSHNEVEWEEGLSLDRIVFDGYLEGLREVGWSGDRRAVRFGYTASTVLRYGFCLRINLSVLVDESVRVRWERSLGRPMEDVADLWGEGGSFLLGLLEEARALMDSM